MVYKGIIKGKVVVLEEGMTLPEGTQVEVVPVQAPRPGSPAALLERIFPPIQSARSQLSS